MDIAARSSGGEFAAVPHSHPRKPHHPVRRGADADGQVDALMDILQAGTDAAIEPFSGSLNLLVLRLGMDLALLTRATAEGSEVFWWAAREGFAPEPFVEHPVSPFFERVMAWSRRTLVVRDTHRDPAWADHPEVRASGIRSYLGAPLWDGARLIGTLGLQGSAPKDFSHAEIVMVAAVARLISKTLEIEELKSQLRLTQEALELSSAVLEDSSLQSPASGLPNLRYLQVWLKANLTLARRHHEDMPLVLLQPEDPAAEPTAIRAVSETLRGADLMVDRGDGTYLLLLPGTPLDGVPLLFDRLGRISPTPFWAGATVWEPASDDLELRGAMRRMKAALKEAQGAGSSSLRWVPEPQGAM